MSSRKWDEELHNYEYTETFVAKRLNNGGQGVLYICRQKSEFADYRYKFSRNMCPRRPRGSEISLDKRCRKCPSDNVNNFVEIEKFFIFGKNYHMSEENFLIFEKNYDICEKILLSSEKIMTYPKIF